MAALTCLPNLGHKKTGSSRSGARRNEDQLVLRRRYQRRHNNTPREGRGRMLDIPNSEALVKHDAESDRPVWGAAAIGRLINKNQRQTHHLLARGLIRSARRVGHQWTEIPSALRREFGA